MADVQFSYVAFRPDGRRARGLLAAQDEAAAFDQLRRQGLAPVALRPKRQTTAVTRRRGSLPARACADFLANLAELLRAGADIRTALSILAGRFENPALRTLSQTLSDDISGGEALERAFERAFVGRHGFVASLVAAGEAAGDLPGALQRSSEILYSRLKLRDQLVSVLAYPTFVLASAVAAVFVILLFIVPSIAPVVEETGGAPPPALSVMIIASDFLRNNGAVLAVAGAAALVILLGLTRAGAFAVPMERLLLDGPLRRTVGGLVFGAFAMSLGTMLTAGAPITEALRLAIRTAPYKAAQRRLEPVMIAVREGRMLSEALDKVGGFPPSVVRLTAVGEASNAVGELLSRGGRLEEESALRRIETVGQVAGPALIVLLGALLGVLMGSLLSGVSQMGQAALG